MRYNPELEKSLREYFSKTKAPWGVTFFVSDYGVSIGENNYGVFYFLITDWEIDTLAARLNLYGEQSECSILLSELYLEEVNTEEKTFLATYNYAWAAISEKIEECPFWMVHIAQYKE